MVEQIFENLETPRLILRLFKPSDLAECHAYRSDPEVERFQGWGDVTLEDTRRYIERVRVRNPGTPGAQGQIAVELKSTGVMIGDLYLHALADEPRQAVIGFTFAREHQRYGYATEAVAALLDYVFNALDFHRVRAIADCENDRSVALLERIGMRREAQFIQSEWSNGKWASLYQYAILQSEWQSNGA